MFARIRQWWRNRKLARLARSAPRYHSGGIAGHHDLPRVLPDHYEIPRDDPRWRTTPVDDVALYGPSSWPLRGIVPVPIDTCSPPAQSGSDHASHCDTGSDGGGSSDSYSCDSGSSDSGGSYGGGGD